jgi:hypothetical protein
LAAIGCHSLGIHTNLAVLADIAASLCQNDSVALGWFASVSLRHCASKSWKSVRPSPAGGLEQLLNAGLEHFAQWIEPCSMSNDRHSQISHAVLV